MNTMLTVPAEIVCQLRQGLQLELGGAAHEIEAVTLEPDREAHPERYDEPLEHLDSIRALLEIVGWGADDRPTAIQIDLCPHRWALLTAMHSTLSVEGDALKDVKAGRVPEQAKRIAIIERERTLREFLAGIGSQCESPQLIG